MNSAFWTQEQSFLLLVIVGIAIGLFLSKRQPGASPSDKDIVREYFNSVGFERWRRIYGTETVNRVQADIRKGHQQTIDTVLGWLKSDGNLSQRSVCDVGCGTGSLSIPLAELGAQVVASDISTKMIEEAQQKSPSPHNPRFQVIDLEHLQGSYETVICLDVLIHYPLGEATKMIQHLASLSTGYLIVSFAPKTLYYDLLKKIGSFFPGASKATRAYLHPEAAIKNILQEAGFTVQRESMTKTQFYFSRLLEAKKTQ